MTDQPPTEKPKTYDGSIADMIRLLINDLIDESQKTLGDNPRERIRNHLKFQAGEGTMHGITALSTYLQAQATDRQAAATEALSKAISNLPSDGTVSPAAASIIEDRESKREHLASTYSLPSETLSLMWAMRGILVDASIKSLAHPERFEPYRLVKTEEIAWALRLTPKAFMDWLPRGPSGIDYELLEDFGLSHFGGTDEQPDDWMFGG